MRVKDVLIASALVGAVGAGTAQAAPTPNPVTPSNSSVLHGAPAVVRETSNTPGLASEPIVWAVMVVGVGVIGAALRRRAARRAPVA